MSISTRLNTYLCEHEISYQELPHHHSHSSIGSAFAAEVPINQVVKAVVLKNHEGRNIMAILPANHKVIFSTINDELHGSYQLAKEREVYQLFSDCEHGAIPPIGEAYNIGMICDSTLDQLNNVYIEAGDHQTLLRINHKDFKQMMATSKHLRFSREVFH